MKNRELRWLLTAYDSCGKVRKTDGRGRDYGPLSHALLGRSGVTSSTRCRKFYYHVWFHFRRGRIRIGGDNLAGFTRGVTGLPCGAG
jgi:hypothetical protein